MYNHARPNSVHYPLRNYQESRYKKNRLVSQSIVQLTLSTKRANGLFVFILQLVFLTFIRIFPTLFDAKKGIRWQGAIY